MAVALVVAFVVASVALQPQLGHAKLVAAWNQSTPWDSALMACDDATSSVVVGYYGMGNSTSRDAATGRVLAVDSQGNWGYSNILNTCAGVAINVPYFNGMGQGVLGYSLRTGALVFNLSDVVVSGSRLTYLGRATFVLTESVKRIGSQVVEQHQRQRDCRTGALVRDFASLQSYLNASFYFLPLATTGSTLLASYRSSTHPSVLLAFDVGSPNASLWRESWRVTFSGGGVVMVVPPAEGAANDVVLLSVGLADGPGFLILDRTNGSTIGTVQASVNASGPTADLGFSPDGRLVFITTAHFDRDQTPGNIHVSAFHVGSNVTNGARALWNRLIPLTGNYDPPGVNTAVSNNFWAIAHTDMVYATTMTVDAFHWTTGDSLGSWQGQGAGTSAICIVNAPPRSKSHAGNGTNTTLGWIAAAFGPASQRLQYQTTAVMTVEP